MLTATARQLVATGAAAATLSLAPLAAVAAPLPSDAAHAPARVLPANQTTDCLDQGKVWLVVQSSKGELMVNKCVEKAASGTELLTSAGVKITKDPKTQMICAMDGEPAACPAKFDGNYWQYYTATKGGKWTFSQVGADQSKPKAGTLEGWCYGKQCTPTMPALDGAAGTASTSAAPSSPASTAPAQEAGKKDTPWATIGVVALLLCAGAAAFLASRRKKA
ncbi:MULTISPECIES: hypothetical protein [unclassified Luteococcus]|uniref:hypothetical protein n=1 Tax=unclassified Luteococcus TaxID=2639923 RepID=UPI00313E05CB